MDSNQDKNLAWYKDAIIYEVHVRSFFDSNADGIGDFIGLIQKLDYIEFLGVNTIWLLPFYPSPLKDDGYDISDYFNVNAIYGSLNDFKLFLRAAHKRNLRVMTELVLNHTSSMHQWFQRSKDASPNSRLRNFYVWSNTHDRFQDARIIFKDFETSNWTWDAVANAYYWHRFYAHQPDLNFDNPAVQASLIKVVDFWLNLGVDALRLDAVPYLFEREGTNCENLPETHAFLKKLRKHVDNHFKNRFLLAEANQWPEDAAAYFGKGDECHMAFHFPMMPRMYTAIEMEDRFPLIDILQQTPTIPENCQWITFLRNHDELTLEMVTDEERDYMYRIYAEDPQMRINLGIRRRLASLLNSDRKKIELMYALLFTLPGTPVIYYGDEIGMGDNIYLGDRNSVRTPMQWSNDLNAGFSKANPQKLFLPVVIDPEYNYQFINVDLQKHNDQSLLWWTKHLISMRKRFKAFGRGSIEFLFPENYKILAFLRKYEDEHILVIINLSRFAQCAKLDLSNYVDRSPIELFGEIEFPKITESPYFVTLNPYSFLCFQLVKVESQISDNDLQYQPVNIEVKNNWSELFKKTEINHLELLLKNYLSICKWVGTQSEKIYDVSMIDHLLIIKKGYQCCYLLFLKVFFKTITETYTFFIVNINKEQGQKIIEQFPNAILALVKNSSGEIEYLVDALTIPEICYELLNLSGKKRHFKSEKAEIIMKPTINYRSIIQDNANMTPFQHIQAEQTNTSMAFGEKSILKLFRRVEFGINPDVEICQFLTDKAHYTHSPRIASSIEYHEGNKIMTVGMIEEFIPHQMTAWNYSLDTLKIFFKQALARNLNEATISLPLPFFIKRYDEIPSEVYQILGNYADSAYLLGIHTGELHLALAKDCQDANFKPELFTSFDLRSLYQSIHSLCVRSFEHLKKNILFFDDAIRHEVLILLNNQQNLLRLVKEILGMKVSGLKIRCHGDYHLGQILYTGKDFVIIDFEGEPDRPLSERRIKRLPLKDVASMLRSFHYAINSAVFDAVLHAPQHEKTLEQWGNYWYRWVCHLFLKGYYEKVDNQLLPSDPEATLILLKLYMLEKAFYEIEYEMNHRPKWLKIPCHGLIDLIWNDK